MMQTLKLQCLYAKNYASTMDNTATTLVINIIPSTAGSDYIRFSILY